MLSKKEVTLQCQKENEILDMKRYPGSLAYRLQGAEESAAQIGGILRYMPFEIACL